MPVGSRVCWAAWICTVQIHAAALALSLLPLAGPAWAQVTPESQRTVDWYAAHPAERAQVRRACLNDPGHLAHSPDCINAKRGDLAAAAGSTREGDSDIDMSDPDTPEYWTRRPADRAFKLVYCDRMTPEHQAAAKCDIPRKSLLAEQQGGSHR